MKTQKPKTKKFKSLGFHWYIYSTKPNVHQYGFKKKRGQKLILSDMRDCRSSYINLPNGRYYEYLIRNDEFLEGKLCKEYKVSYTKIDPTKQRLAAIEIFESLDSKYIESQGICFDVKGGVVKFSEVPKINKDPADKIKKANEKYMKFIKSHHEMGHLTTSSYYHFMEIYNECQWFNKSIPYKIKDLLMNVYSSHNNKKMQNRMSDIFVKYKKECLLKNSKHYLFKEFK